MNTNYNFNNLSRWLRQCLSVSLLTFLLVGLAGANAQTAISATSTSTNSPLLRANGKIAFTSDRDGNREIYLMNNDGTNQVRLTNNAGADDFPAWSSDGRRLGFLSQNASGTYVIKLMNADGTGPTELTPVLFDGIFDPSAGPRWGMNWSPDGTKIAFTNGHEIFAISIDGSNRVNLTNTASFDSHPSWSPDGSSIVFSSDRAGGQFAFRLFTMNADGSNQTALPGGSSGNYTGDVDPAWSPDGIKLAGVQRWLLDVGVFFIRNVSGTWGFLDWTIDRDSSSPAWSPDGTKIAYSAVISPYVQYSNVEIFVINADGSGLTQLTNTGGYEAHPAWQPLAPSACSNPIDCADFFVRQHYLDFLNRPADDLGLAFWTNQITQCGTNANCIEDKRVNVSAAFFLSIEFQQTGYLVYRMHKAAYGDMPGRPVPLTRQEFLPDTQRVGQGVVVGAPGWEQQLENNKNAFASEFVARSRFTTAFPLGMTAEQFVDGLNANAGGALSQAERDQLVSELASGAKTRAQVLRSVAEDADLARNEFNKAFVLMQYFAYLRRNPNDAPDANFDGFNFWLNKLNQFNGNFVAADMVKSFISSGEYRQRFGQP